MINLRMSKLLEYITKDDSIVDIGCDHGYGMIAAVLEKGVQQALGLDINEGPLKNGEKNVISRGLQKEIKFRLSDGLSDYRIGEGNLLILAGIGGKTIGNILLKGKSKLSDFNKIIIQPMNNLEYLRRIINQLNFKIVSESILKDDRLYVFMELKKGKEIYQDDFFYKVGFKLWESKNLYLNEYIDYQISDLKKIIRGLNLSFKDETKKIKDIKKEIELWEKHKI